MELEPRQDEDLYMEAWNMEMGQEKVTGEKQRIEPEDHSAVTITDSLRVPTLGEALPTYTVLSGATVCQVLHMCYLNLPHGVAI